MGPAGEAPTYRLGTPLRFSANGEALRFPLEGLYAAEFWGAWIRDGHANLRLSVDAAGLEGRSRARLVLELTHFLGGQRDRSEFRVRVNGEKVLGAEEVERGARRYVVEFAAPRPDARRRLELEVDIEGLAPRSPSQLGIGADPRALSVGLISLTVEAAT